MSGFIVEHDHKIVDHNPDLMQLHDSDGAVIVTAARDGQTWHVTSDSTDEHAPDRAAALKMMTDHAYEHLGPINDQGHGYVTLTPLGLAEQP